MLLLINKMEMLTPFFSLPRLAIILGFFSYCTQNRRSEKD